jgi:hypothetical protein
MFIAESKGSTAAVFKMRLSGRRQRIGVMPLEDQKGETDPAGVTGRKVTAAGAKVFST